MCQKCYDKCPKDGKFDKLVAKKLTVCKQANFKGYKNHCDCGKCDKGKCVKKYKIQCLPYIITCPGTYCLAHDFTWANNTKSAISILNTENVTLNFNDRKINVAVPTELPTVLVEGSTDVTLNDVHVDGSQANGEVYGVLVQDSEDVEVNRLTIINVGAVGFTAEFGFRAINVTGLNLLNTFARNDVFKPQGVYVNDSLNVTVSDSKLKESRMVIRGSRNMDILRSNIECLIPSGIDTATPRALFIQIGCSNIRVSDNTLVGEGLGLNIDNCSNVIVENNNVDGAGMFNAFLTNCHFKNNTFNFTRGAGLFTGLDIYNAVRCVIDGNTITSPGAPEGEDIYGISVYGLTSFGEDSVNNVVKNNVVTNCTIGYTDFAAPFNEENAALNTLFQNNVASGNGINFDIKGSTSVLSNNTQINQVGLPSAAPATATTKLAERLERKPLP